MIVQESMFKIQEPTAMKLIKEGNKSIYFKMLWTSPLPCGMCKWNNAYDDLNWKHILHVCHKTTQNYKLRWFQLRLIYKTLPTNRYLFFRKIVDSQLCSFCGNENETIVHMLWHCHVVRKFWTELEETFSSKCECLVNFHFDERLILFGVNKHINTNIAMDLIIFVAKYYVYQCKRKTTEPKVLVFLAILKKRYGMEKYIFKTQEKMIDFDTLWQPYRMLFL